jgi:hypothetical protein
MGGAAGAPIIRFWAQLTAGVAGEGQVPGWDMRSRLPGLA